VAYAGRPHCNPPRPLESTPVLVPTAEVDSNPLRKAPPGGTWARLTSSGSPVLAGAVTAAGLLLLRLAGLLGLTVALLQLLLARVGRGGGAGILVGITRGGRLALRRRLAGGLLLGVLPGIVGLAALLLLGVLLLLGLFLALLLALLRILG